jgi:hypothetical protein
VARARTDCPRLRNGVHDVCPPRGLLHTGNSPRYNSTLRSSMAPGLVLAHSALLEAKIIVLDMLLAINKTEVRRRLMKGKYPVCFRHDIDAVCQNTPPATCSLGISQHCCGDYVGAGYVEVIQPTAEIFDGILRHHRLRLLSESEILSL